MSHVSERPVCFVTGITTPQLNDSFHTSLRVCQQRLSKVQNHFLLSLRACSHEQPTASPSPIVSQPSSRTESDELPLRGRTLIASRASELVSDDADGEPLLHVVFVHPQIHWNTGNIGRTCLGLGARLHLVKPLGFSLDARQIRRAGLDYWHHVDVHVYDDWQQFAQGEMKRIGGTRYFFTKFGDQSMTNMDWAQDQKIVLIFGSEVDGFDGIREWLDTEGKNETLVAFPMVDDRFRSFNLSTTASMALWDAYKTVNMRQQSNR